MVVADGGSGFAAAVAEGWPQTRVQRCTFHAFCQVRRYTTSRPRLQAGIELYGLACELLHVEDLRQAERWLERLLDWCRFWSDFLEERSVVDGRMSFTHERLRKARRSLVTLLNSGTLFTYLDPQLTAEDPLPATNNRIEGAVNARIREMLRNHRGLTTLRRAARGAGGSRYIRLVDAFRGLERGPYPRCELAGLIPERFSLDLAGLGHEGVGLYRAGVHVDLMNVVALFIARPLP